MPEAQVTIEGLDELVKKLEDIRQLKKVHAGIKAGALYLKGKLAEYPPQTAANVPNHKWYVRGFGWRFASGRSLAVSEDLAASWTIRYDKTKFEAVVGTNVSYGPFVVGPKQGPKGKRQAKHMADIGWKSIDTVAEQEQKRVSEYIVDAVRRSLEG